MLPSLRVQAVQTPVIPLVAEMIRAHPGTISLGQGVVHYGPPPSAMRRVGDFFSDAENHKYKAVDGLPGLKQALSEKLLAENAIRVSAENPLVVTAGGNMAFVNALLAIADPGDEIILLTPYYFNHEMAVRLANCVPVAVATDSAHQPDLQKIQDAITRRTRAVVTVSPNNPTGAVYARETLSAINALCRERGLYHISDEAYAAFVFEGARHFSPASLEHSAGHTISLFSLSKSHGFASWRIGWMVLPRALLESVMKIQDTILICPPVISQVAAEGALNGGGDYVRSQISGIAAVRADALALLRTIPELCSVTRSQGALYFFLRLNLELEPMTLIERLIREHRVALMPGHAFGAAGCCARVSFGALQAGTIHEGIGRLVEGLKIIVK